MSGKWMAQRSCPGATREEDAAMAHVAAGPYDSEAEALLCLGGMVEREVAAWEGHGWDASRDREALARLRAGESDVTVGGVRWNVYEY